MGNNKVTEGIRLALPFAAADILDGVAFGAVAAGIGLGVAAPTLMSATAFSGSAQFATLTVLNQHGGLLSILLAVVALNARYLAYSASVAPALSTHRLKRLLQAQLLTDASWALAFKDGSPDAGLLSGAGGIELIGWVTGTAIGALAGSAVGNYRAFGLDAAIPTFFLCVLLARLHDQRAALPPALAAAAAAVALAPLLPAGLPLILIFATASLRKPTR